MPGVPKSQACRNCKARKVRCDLNWPTCGRCKRANKECPGPSTMLKWIEDSSSAGTLSPPADESLAIAQSKQSPTQQGQPLRPGNASVAGKQQSTPVSIVSVDSKDVGGGGSYGLFRLSSGPKAHPTTSADRLAAQLVRQLDGPHGEAFHILNYFELLPNRLCLSPALRDSVGLFCSAWLQYRRGSSATEVLNHVIEPYGKAVRSVRRALSDPHEQLRTETLAAICVLERFDILLNANRKPLSTVHISGICSLMYKRGPPDLSDELDIRLALESQTTLIPYWVAQGGRNFYLEDGWSYVLDASRNKLIEKDDSGILARSFGMDRLSNHLPAIIDESQYIHSHLDEPGITNRIDALLARLETLHVGVEELGGDVFENGDDLGMIMIVPNPKCPGGCAYDFAMMPAFELISAYILLKFLCIKMTVDLSAVVGRQTGSLHDELGMLCRHICMLEPYVRGLGPIASTLLSTVFYLVYAMGTDEEAEFCLKFIVDADRFIQRLPKGRPALRWRILKIFSGIVGQVSFPDVRRDLKRRGDELYTREETML